MKTKTVILASSALLFASFLFVSVASAKSDTLGRGRDIEASDSSKPFVTPSATGTNSPKNAARLEANRLRVCQVKEKTIGKRTESLSKLVASMLGKFDEIAERVKAYYLASGKTVPNYDALVADIAAKKDAAYAALAKAQLDFPNFDCTGADPKGQLTLYRTDMQQVKMSLHAYRTAIKNLIVAIRGQIKDDGFFTSPTPTATPTETPTATP